MYDHVVIVIEENKDYGEIIGNPHARYLNRTLRAEGANLTRIFGEEHHSQEILLALLGQQSDVGFVDSIPAAPITAPNLGRGIVHERAHLRRLLGRPAGDRLAGRLRQERGGQKELRPQAQSVGQF